MQRATATTRLLPIEKALKTDILSVSARLNQLYVLLATANTNTILFFLFDLFSLGKNYGYFSVHRASFEYVHM